MEIKKRIIGMKPIQIVPIILEANPHILELNFVIYKPIRNLSENFRIEDNLYHNFYDTILELNKKEILEGGLTKMISKLKKDEVIGLTSKVLLRGDLPRHLPLMDFNSKPSNNNLHEIKRFLRKAGQKRGVILQSQRSYHYYGLRVCDDTEWNKFLGYSLLYGCDERYIGHTLIADYATLRMTAGGIRKEAPKVVALI